MLDKMGDRIDAVTVSMPDHNHAVAAAKAMKMGKHVYCQKPLTHSIWEARRLGEIAREKGVATQMGNQCTAHNPMRKAAYQIRAGQLGTVKEVHIWTNRPIWPQGENRAADQAGAHDAELGSVARPGAVAAVRRRLSSVRVARLVGLRHRRAGRHGLPHVQPAVHGAQHARPESRSRPSAPSTTATAIRRGRRSSSSSRSWTAGAAFTMYWYDGGNLPPTELFKDVTLTVKDEDGKEVPPPWKSGVLLIGDKATMYAAGDYAEQGIQIVGAEEMDVEYPKSPGHEKEWFDAMRDPSKPAMSNFPDYAGPLTETILLGNLAVWKRGRVEWDPENLKPLNDPSLEKIVRTEYRDGYEV